MFLHFLSLVIHVHVLYTSLVPKGYANNFTFSEEDNFEEVAKITLPSYLFRNQGNVVQGTNQLRFAPGFTPYNGLYGELRPKGVPILGFSYIKGLGVNQLKCEKG